MADLQSGFRYWWVKPPRTQRLVAGGNPWTPLRGVAATADWSLGAPYAPAPWGPGWVEATCATCPEPCQPECTCGLAFFPTMEELIEYLLPKDWRARLGRLRAFEALAARLGDDASPPVLELLEHFRTFAQQGVQRAVGRIETRDPWLPDPTHGAFRAARARVAELWLSPSVEQSAEQISEEYGGIPVHKATGEEGLSWLLSLSPAAAATADVGTELFTPEFAALVVASHEQRRVAV